MSDQDELVECPTCARRHPSSVGTCPDLEAVLSPTADTDEGFDRAGRFGRDNNSQRQDGNADVDRTASREFCSAEEGLDQHASPDHSAPGRDRWGGRRSDRPALREAKTQGGQNR